MRCGPSHLAHFLCLKRAHAWGCGLWAKPMSSGSDPQNAFTLPNQANHLLVKQLQNRGYLNRAKHSDGEIFYQFYIDEATSPLRGAWPARSIL